MCSSDLDYIYRELKRLSTSDGDVKAVVHRTIVVAMSIDYLASGARDCRRRWVYGYMVSGTNQAGAYPYRLFIIRLHLLGIQPADHVVGNDGWVGRTLQKNYRQYIETHRQLPFASDSRCGAIDSCSLSDFACSALEGMAVVREVHLYRLVATMELGDRFALDGGSLLSTLADGVQDEIEASEDAPTSDSDCD